VNSLVDLIWLRRLATKKEVKASRHPTPMRGIAHENVALLLAADSDASTAAAMATPSSFNRTGASVVHGDVSKQHTCSLQPA